MVDNVDKVDKVDKVIFVFVFVFVFVCTCYIVCVLYESSKDRWSGSKMAESESK